MEIDLAARVHAVELLTTQLVSEYLRSFPDAAARALSARGELSRLADNLSLGSDRPDEAARLQAAIKHELARLLDGALARAEGMKLQQPSYPASPG